MTIINTIQELENKFAFPFIYNIGDKRIISATIILEDLLQSTKNQIEIKPIVISDIFIDQLCTFNKIYSLVDPAYKLTVKNFIDTLFFNSGIYVDSFLRCTFIFNVGNKLTGENNSYTIQRYISIPTIDKELSNNHTKLSNCNITYNKEQAQIVFAIKNDSIINFDLITSVHTTYSDIDIYKNSYIKENYIERNISINNYEMDKIYVICIYTDTFTKKKKAEYFIFDKLTVLLPTIKTIPKDHTVNDTMKKYDFQIHLSCNVFNGIQNVDYSSFFLKEGFQLSVQGNTNLVNNSQFYIYKNIVKK